MGQVRSMVGTRSSDAPVSRSELFFLELASTASVPNMLRADISSIIPSDITKSRSRMETEQYAPIVTINDLSKENARGDTVEVVIEHDLNNLPTMCCDPLEGREEESTWATFDMKIGMTRHGVRDRCTMDRVRLGDQAFERARPKLQRYIDRLKAERIIYHMAGARGHEYNSERNILPLDGKDFRKAMINCVEAPSYCRHFYGGDATDFDGQCGDPLDKDDIFSLDTITKVMAAMEDSAHPLLPIKMDGMSSDVKYLWLVTPAQWRDFKLSSDGKFYRQLLNDGQQRVKNCTENAALRGECLYWDGVLVKRYTGAPVRFKPGHALNIARDDDCATEETAMLAKDADFCVDRSMLLGGAALAEAWGSVKDAENKRFGKDNFVFWQGTYDGGEGKRVHIKCLGGEKKIRFASKSGRVYDHGVAVVDTAVQKDSLEAC